MPKTAPTDKQLLDWLDGKTIENHTWECNTQWWGTFLNNTVTSPGPNEPKTARAAIAQAMRMKKRPALKVDLR